VRDCVVSFLNRVTGAGYSLQAQRDYWNHIATAVTLRYGVCALTEDEINDLSTLCEPLLGRILLYTLKSIGLELTDKCRRECRIAYGMSRPKKSTSESKRHVPVSTQARALFEFTIVDLRTTSARVKHMAVLDYATGTYLSLQATRHRESTTVPTAEVTLSSSSSSSPRSNGSGIAEANVSASTLTSEQRTLTNVGALRLLPLAASHFRAALTSQPLDFRSTLGQVQSRALYYHLQNNASQCDALMVRQLAIALSRPVPIDERNGDVRALLSEIFTIWNLRRTANPTYRLIGGAWSQRVLLEIGYAVCITSSLSTRVELDKDTIRAQWKSLIEPRRIAFIRLVSRLFAPTPIVDTHMHDPLSTLVTELHPYRSPFMMVGLILFELSFHLFSSLADVNTTYGGPIIMPTTWPGTKSSSELTRNRYLLLWFGLLYHYCWPSPTLVLRGKVTPPVSPMVDMNGWRSRDAAKSGSRSPQLSIPKCTRRLNRVARQLLHSVCKQHAAVKAYIPLVIDDIKRSVVMNTTDLKDNRATWWMDSSLPPSEPNYRRTTPSPAGLSSSTSTVPPVVPSTLGVSDEPLGFDWKRWLVSSCDPNGLCSQQACSCDVCDQTIQSSSSTISATTGAHKTVASSSVVCMICHDTELEVTSILSSPTYINDGRHAIQLAFYCSEKAGDIGSMSVSAQCQEPLESNLCELDGRLRSTGLCAIVDDFVPWMLPLLNAYASYGFDLNYRRNGMGTPLEALCSDSTSNASVEMIRQLLYARADANSSLPGRLGSPLTMVCSDFGGDVNTAVELLLEYGASVNYIDDTGQQALSRAASRGYHGVVRQLLAAGAPLVPPIGWHEKWQDPFAAACGSGEEVIMTMLLDHGATPTGVVIGGNV
jgi:hypothetical protein